MDKENKMKAIRYFLDEVLNKEYPLEKRKEEMLRVGVEVCKGFPSWSDCWGYPIRALDDVSWKELSKLLEEIK